LRKSKKPARTGSVLYGIHPVVETLRAGRRAVDRICLARRSRVDSRLEVEFEKTRVPVTRISADEMLSITGTTHHQGVAAHVGPFPYAQADDLLSQCVGKQEVLVVLDEIQDPANLGNILRIAEGLGAAGIILAKDRSVDVTPTVEKASAGASAHISVARVVNLVRSMERLKAAGFWIYAADPHSRDVCYSVDLTGKIAFVFGSEGKGLRRLVRERCDAALSIPMRGRTESLNVAQSVAILLSESLRQREIGKADQTDKTGRRE